MQRLGLATAMAVSFLVFGVAGASATTLSEGVEISAASPIEHAASAEHTAPMDHAAPTEHVEIVIDEGEVSAPDPLPQISVDGEDQEDSQGTPLSPSERTEKPTQVPDRGTDAQTQVPAQETSASTNTSDSSNGVGAPESSDDDAADQGDAGSLTGDQLATQADEGGNEGGITAVVTPNISSARMTPVVTASFGAAKHVSSVDAGALFSDADVEEALCTGSSPLGPILGFAGGSIALGAGLFLVIRKLR